MIPPMPDGWEKIHHKMFLQDRDHAMSENRGDRTNRIAITTLILSFIVGAGVVAFQPGDARYFALAIPYLLFSLAMFLAAYNQNIDTNKEFIKRGNEAWGYRGHEEYVKATRGQ